MNIFKKLFVSKNENAASFRREMAHRLDGRHIKYVTERIYSDTGSVDDRVIGRNGSLLVRDDEFIVYASADILFRTKLDTLRASELLSLDGAIIEGPDLEHDGVERTVVAYYTYHLKVQP